MILITMQSEEVARKLAEHFDMISVSVMKEGCLFRLLKKKLGNCVDMNDILNLATELENMLLALTQEATYLRQMSGRYSVRQHLERLRKSEKSKMSIRLQKLAYLARRTCR